MTLFSSLSVVDHREREGCLVYDEYDRCARKESERDYTVFVIIVANDEYRDEVVAVDPIEFVQHAFGGGFDH